VTSAIPNVCRFIATFVLVLIATAPGTAQSTEQLAADAKRVIEALDIHSGSVVAEIGAGDGALTLRIAEAVGSTGRVFSNELSQERGDAIRAQVQKAGRQNVTIVTGGDDDTGLPDRCCDGIFMRDVYHHFTNPVAMNASILKALRPGGKLVILEFGPPPGSESPDVARRAEDGQHGITPATLERELTAAGFEILSTQAYGFRSAVTIARSREDRMRPVRVSGASDAIPLPPETLSPTQALSTHRRPAR
jgi:ubiquinone/menaquinone biosynthesis C-methylase UbiE